MNEQDLLKLLLTILGGGGGVVGLWAITSRWLDGRRALSERRANIELDALSEEQKERVNLVRSQARAVEEMTKAQERMALSLQEMVAEQRQQTAVAQQTSARLDNVEAGIAEVRGMLGRLLAIPPDAGPRAPTASASGAQPPPQR